jgi:hypothetical protein
MKYKDREEKGIHNCFFYRKDREAKAPQQFIKPHQRTIFIEEREK